MRTAMKVMVRIVMIVVLLAIGFAVGFPMGRETGFLTGSEWAMLQASIVAREAGMSMPVTYEDGRLHVVVKQPQYRLYHLARQRATLGTGTVGLRTPGAEEAERVAPLAGD